MTLNERVQTLAVALSQGHSTVADLLANQSIVFREHLDRRLNDQARKEAEQRFRGQFKESLFFPEMFSRHDDIPKSHQGTCRWIFSGVEGEGEEPSENTKQHPSHSFKIWLSKDEDTYWWVDSSVSSSFV